MADLKKLGKYDIQSILGQGAMGIVYKGFDPNIERTVAIKTIRKDALDRKELEPLLARFKREAQAAGRLTHPGIITVYEYGDENNSAYIAMEYVVGRELKDFLDKNERFPLNTIISMIGQLLDALAYSHEQGVIHRDIKPGNILIVDGGQIKVMDFGIARIESSTLTQFGDVMGTPSYMSPEQFAGQQVDKRSDLFSTGVILYHLLTGEKPFPGNSMTTIMHRVLNTNPPLLSELNVQIPSFLDDVLLKALAKKPEERYQSAEEFKAALKKVSTDSKETEISEESDEETVVISGNTDLTLNIPSEEIAIATQQVKPTGEHGDLQHKFDKIVDLLESQGISTGETEKNLYEKSRKWVLTILVLAILSVLGYAVWAIYSDDLTYDELEQIAKEKVVDISALFTGKSTKVIEISQTLKTKPVNEFGDSPDQKKSARASSPSSTETPIKTTTPASNTSSNTKKD